MKTKIFRQYVLGIHYYNTIAWIPGYKYRHNDEHNVNFSQFELGWLCFAFRITGIESNDEELVNQF